MKLNETLLIVGALLAALVLSKGGAVSSIFKKSSVPFMPLENKTISFIENIPQLEKFKQFFPVKETNVQLKNIINIEEKENQQRVGYLQNELDSVQDYISRQVNTAPKEFAKIAPPNVSGINLLNRFDNQLNYYQKFWSGEKGSISGLSVFPDFKLLLTQSNRNIIADQAQYETTQTNIAKANEYAIRQQGDIDDLNAEYQTRFGSLSRYG
jgi:hypothetical protein